jgi:hypothetical protein
LREYSSALLEESTNIQNYVSSMEEALTAEIEGWNEKLADQNSLLEYH